MITDALEVGKTYEFAENVVCHDEIVNRGGYEAIKEWCAKNRYWIFCLSTLGGEKAYRLIPESVLYIQRKDHQ